MRRVLAPLVLLCIAAAALTADSCARHPEPAGGGKGTPSTTGADCMECHPAFVASYRRTGMARAAGPIEKGELEGLDPVADVAGGFTYELDGDQGGRVVESFGASTASHPLSFAVGAGLLDRSYVARRGELSWFAPLEVMSARPGRPRHAALAPGNAIHAGLRLSSPITEECLGCHTDALPPREYPLNWISPEFAATGISCAACHGDGLGHAAWQRKALAGAVPGAPDPILAFGDAPLVERLSVCARCHLQGDARIALAKGDRGTPPPGGDLLGRRAVFVASGDSAEIGFVSHVERMVASRCFEASLPRGGLTCQTCHDPHVSVFEAGGRREARDGCFRCHTPGAAEPVRGGAPRTPCALAPERRGGSDCVACHMRRTAPFDLEEVEIHDHLVSRRPPPPSSFERIRAKASAATKDRAPAEIEPFAWPGFPRPAWVDDAGIRLVAEAAADHPARAAALVDAPPGPVARALPMYHHVRATTLERLGRDTDAEASYRAALALDPDQAESSVNLGTLLGRLGRAREGIAVLDAVLARHPKAESALRNRALLSLSLGDRGAFARDLEAAFAILPHAPSARALAQAYARMGDGARAAEWSRRARELDPRER